MTKDAFAYHFRNFDGLLFLALRPSKFRSNDSKTSSFHHSAIASIVCDLAPQLGTLKAARALHNSLLRGIMRAPVMFFDSTPIGRILGRFSADQEELDNSLPHIVSDGLYCFLEVTEPTIH